MTIKTYELLLAIDVPHYGTATIEAETPEAALEAARRLEPAALCDDPGWEGAFCARIVHLEGPAGALVAEDVQLDEHNAFVLVGYPDRIRLARAAGDMFAALEAQEQAEFDPAAARRKGYFDRARELRIAALKKARLG